MAFLIAKIANCSLEKKYLVAGVRNKIGING